MVERKKFRDVFQEEGQSLILLIKVKVKDEIFDKGTSFTDKQGLAGVDFHKFRYLDVGGEMEAEGTFKITGFYARE